MATTTTGLPLTDTAEANEMARDLGSFSSGVEKRCLVWMAERLPRRINSDHLTVLGLIGMAGAGLSFWLGSAEPLALLGVVVFLAINWFGDSLDGTVARVRNAQRPKYGYYVDHVVDVFGTFFLLAGLGSSSFMSLPVAVAVLIAYLMVASEIYLAAYSVGTFKIDFLRIGPTELRILLALGTLWLLRGPNVTLFGSRYLLFDVGGVVAVVGLVVTLLVTVFKNTRTLYRREPLR